ncbi:MAG: hydrogenase 3 maturation endopeptidase HyCI [Anaerolineaceae bacterium]|nr:hydrogenase 3 maturation endopeptidase HyCI [Anaerolineaceae bacterium]
MTILGIGNELNGDDAAGVLIVRYLKKKLPKFDQIQLIEGSIAPENYSGVIRTFNPDWIWLIDAAVIGKNPGDVQLFDPSSIETVVANTHRMSPGLLISFLQIDTNAEVFLIGIQPEIVDPFSEPSPKVKTSIQETSKFLLRWLQNNYNI